MLDPNHLAAVLDSMPFAITSLRPDGVILFVNEIAARNLSGTRESVIGQSVYDYFPARAAATKQRIRQTLDQGTPQTFESVVTLPNGSERFFDSTYSPTFDNHGNAVSVQIIARDVTARRAAEQAESASKGWWGLPSDDLSMTIERMKAVLGTAAVVISVLDVDMTVRYINHAPPGADASQAIGRSAMESIEPADRPRLEATFAQLLSTREIVECEVVGLSGRTWLIRFAPLIHNDEVAQVLACALDVTEQKRLRQQLSQKRTLESLGTLARGIAHDFNNLLTAIMGQTGIARVRLQRSGDVGPLLDEIDAASRRAADLCEQMLVYAGRDVPDDDLCDIGEVVRETVPLTRAASGDHIDVSLALADDGVCTRCSRAQLAQVVLNLVNNAADAIGEAGGYIRVSTDTVTITEHEDGYLPAAPPPGRYGRLVVNDSGPGVDDAILHKIFDPFYSTKSTGHGLGLSVVLGILASRDAAIRVGPSPDGGTSMTVLLPVTDDANPAPEPPTDARPQRGDGIVLVVDDDAIVRRVACAVLEEAGYDVVPAASGDEALAVLPRWAARTRAILLDVTMPGLDGYATLAELRKNHTTLPVVLTSGKPIDATTDDPFLGRLRKPYSPEALERAIAEAIRSAGQ